VEVLQIAEKNTGKVRCSTRPGDGIEPRMPGIRAELAAKGLPTDDEACVLFEMFPREFEKLHAPPEVKQPAAPSSISSTPVPTHSGSPGSTRMRLTIQGVTSDILIEEN